MSGEFFELMVMGQIISKEMEETGRGEGNVLCQECYVNVLAGGKRNPACRTSTIRALDPAGGAWTMDNMVRASARAKRAHRCCLSAGKAPPEPPPVTGAKERAC